MCVCVKEKTFKMTYSLVIIFISTDLIFFKMLDMHLLKMQI